MPFRLTAGADAVAATVRLHGLAGGAYQRFQPGTDLTIGDDGSLVWKASASQPGQPAAGATWPDEGSHFDVSYEKRSAAAPRLTDRNPGSITRTLAESFAREYAVLSRQLESVYRAAFLETAEGRDLDQLAALVGVTRRTRLAAAGELVFSRITPANGDIFIPAGTRVSTADSPAVTVETTEDAVLRSGSSSQGVTVRSLAEGAAGVAKAGTLTVIHRPILGIQAATNGQDLAFSGDVEDDAALRSRTARALETGGAATVDALIGALTAVDGIREQDVLVAEDHVASPGVLKITIAADIDAE
ncbi:MAG: baseplate J/gp47 family protein, partial [Burkholderiales bacterium]|nr:baseplate J/gp47 family protein [Burkholderiales bacterium]